MGIVLQYSIWAADAGKAIHQFNAGSYMEIARYIWIKKRFCCSNQCLDWAWWKFTICPHLRPHDDASSGISTPLSVLPSDPGLIGSKNYFSNAARAVKMFSSFRTLLVPTGHHVEIFICTMIESPDFDSCSDDWLWRTLWKQGRAWLGLGECLSVLLFEEIG